MSRNRADGNPWGAVANQPKSNSADKKKQRDQANPKPVEPASGKSKGAPPSAFELAQSKHLAAAQKLASGYASSSDEDELAEDSLLASVFKDYAGDRNELGRTQLCLENVFQSGAATCLICIATVRRVDHIWSCEHCFNFFHLGCIQRWANDSTSQKRVQQSTEVGYYNNQGEYVAKVKKAIKWDCPKCRHDYGLDEIPRDYNCFCGKELNPPNHPWLVPHSCGELCRKPLKPDCGHRCVLLCHPGPCPPCPQMIAKSCRCGQSNLRTIRCSQQSWKCLNKCKQKLSCGTHPCLMPCHDKSECPPCTKKSQQRCMCGASTQERNCDSLQWQCDKLCGKPFSCGLHRCELRCHEGACGDCPRGEPRSCPCGKEVYQVPCSDDVLPCGSTCQKPLECGVHICMERCHKDKCSQCLVTTKKHCRCGMHEKELPCSKAYVCDTKCKQMRYCNKHTCNRKCCDKDCPPCDKICGKMLSCNKHKCTSLCHMGQCYPCPQRTTIKCRCGHTSAEVACGREKRTRPPKCSMPCRLPSKCHHSTPHRCHLHECPPCNELCGQPNETTHCEHLCQVRCHDAVRITVVDKNFKPAGPWEKPPEKVLIKKLPHPECGVKVSVTCIGGHETVDLPCHSSKPLSCGRPCGRRLQCGNHTCPLQCHSVSDLTSEKQDTNCAPCQEGCIHTRPKNCVHSCDKPCHLGPCTKCRINIKLDCHCGLSPVYSKCGDFYNGADAASDSVRDKLRCCNQRCSRNVSTLTMEPKVQKNKQNDPIKIHATVLTKFVDVRLETEVEPMKWSTTAKLLTVSDSKKPKTAQPKPIKNIVIQDTTKSKMRISKPNKSKIIPYATPKPLSQPATKDLSIPDRITSRMPIAKPPKANPNVGSVIQIPLPRLDADVEFEKHHWLSNPEATIYNMKHLDHQGFQMAIRSRALDRNMLEYPDISPESHLQSKRLIMISAFKNHPSLYTSHNNQFEMIQKDLNVAVVDRDGLLNIQQMNALRLILDQILVDCEGQPVPIFLMCEMRFDGYFGLACRDAATKSWLTEFVEQFQFLDGVRLRVVPRLELRYFKKLNPQYRRDFIFDEASQLFEMGQDDLNLVLVNRSNPKGTMSANNVSDLVSNIPELVETSDNTQFMSAKLVDGYFRVACWNSGARDWLHNQLNTLNAHVWTECVIPMPWFEFDVLNKLKATYGIHFKEGPLKGKLTDVGQTHRISKEINSSVGVNMDAINTMKTQTLNKPNNSADNISTTIQVKNKSIESVHENTQKPKFNQHEDIDLKITNEDDYLKVAVANMDDLEYKMTHEQMGLFRGRLFELLNNEPTARITECGYDDGILWIKCLNFKSKIWLRDAVINLNQVVWANARLWVIPMSEVQTISKV